jgi:hypothetical protein
MLDYNSLFMPFSFFREDVQSKAVLIYVPWRVSRGVVWCVLLTCWVCRFMLAGGEKCLPFFSRQTFTGTRFRVVGHK